MSEHWEQFPCSMGDRIAFISYDHGVRDALEALPFPFFASFRIEMLKPDEDGLPLDEELPMLDEIEVILCQNIVAQKGIHVGRITTNGRRYLHFYVSISRDECDLLAEQASRRFGHDIALAHEPDVDRSKYWNELYPTADDWQVIRDISIQDALERAGDTLVEPRVIEHRVVFPSEPARSAFLAEVGHAFSDIDLSVPHGHEGSRFFARLRHASLPDYRSMNHTTLLIARAARQHEGDYEGWESPVCRS